MSDSEADSCPGRLQRLHVPAGSRSTAPLPLHRQDATGARRDMNERRDGPAPMSHAPGMPATLLRLQRDFGNRYVARMVDLARDGPDGTVSPDAVEQTIEQARRGGQALDRATQDRMESAFGADFSGLRVHTDTRADGLNQALSAKAFATGEDIFFRQGHFDPGSTAGRELLAHELTHVVQQGGGSVQCKLNVSAPDDPQEVEADRMARAVTEAEHQPPAAAAAEQR